MRAIPSAQPAPSSGLAPCPFCSHTTAPKPWTYREMVGEDYWDDGNADSFAVVCDAEKPDGPGGCGGSGGFFPTEEAAIAAWNRRPAAPAATQAQAEPVLWVNAGTLELVRMAGKATISASSEKNAEEGNGTPLYTRPAIASAPVGDGATQQAGEEAALNYYRAAVLKVRPDWLPARVRLPRVVFGDGPFGRGAGVAAGDHDCQCNQWGAVSVIDRGGEVLGLRPAEFEVIAWRRADTSAQAGDGNHE